MTSPIIVQIQGSVGQAGLSLSETIELSILLLAWARLSSSEQIPAELRLTRRLLDDPKQIEPTMTRLVEFGDDRFVVFEQMRRLVVGNFLRILPAFELVVRLIETGLTAGLVESTVLDRVSQFSEGLMTPEIGELFIGISALKAADSVYFPWDFSGYLAARAMRNHDVKAYVENPGQSPLPALIAILLNKPFEIHHADPIKHPSAVIEGKPRKFDVSIALPPIGIRHDSKVSEQDWFGRFRQRTTSGTVLAIRHLLWQTRRRVVVGVPNSLLFSAGAELELRRELIDRGMVEAVVAMRSGLLMHTSIPFSVLILDPRGGHEEIRFVAADSERFAKPLSKARFGLTNVDKLIELVMHRSEDGDVRNVPIAEIGSDAQLQVNRYVLSEIDKQLLDRISSAKTVPVGHLVTTVRPMPSKAGEGTPVSVLEVGAADLPPYGYITSPGRIIEIDSHTSGVNEDQYLRSNDIVLIVKGSVGKIGIVSPDAPGPGPSGWVAGQSAIILRAHVNPAVDPRALAVQLRSEFGQGLLRRIVSDATIPLIQLRELAALPVLLPSLEEQRRAVEILDREMEIQLEIDRLQQLQASISRDLWNLDSDKSVPNHQPAEQKPATS